MGLLNNEEPILKNLDYLLLATGSDSRAYEILRKFKDFSRTKVIFFNFFERVRDLRSDDQLFDYKTFPLNEPQVINCEIRNPSSCLEEILKNNFRNENLIGIDISCFTKPYFYFIFKLLRERFHIEDIIAFYTEPKSYLFHRGLFTDFHTSSGPLSILEIPGYSGQEIRGTKRKLVILLGFDGDLSKEINEDVSPNNTLVVNGFPAYTSKFKDISLMTNEKLVGDRNISISYAKANNPFDTYNLLHSLKDTDKDSVFLNIAPLGTKPMALGACLFALHNPDVRIIYPLPETYEKKYSDKCWNTWLYKLPLIEKS